MKKWIRLVSINSYTLIVIICCILYGKEAGHLSGMSLYQTPQLYCIALSGVGFVATFAESKKISKYSHLLPSYLFSPIAIESLGALGAKSSSLIRELGKRIRHHSGEESAFPFLLQRLSIAVQRGNASLIMDTLPSSFDTIFPYDQ